MTVVRVMQKSLHFHSFAEKHICAADRAPVWETTVNSADRSQMFDHAGGHLTIDNHSKDTIRIPCIIHELRVLNSDTEIPRPFLGYSDAASYFTPTPHACVCFALTLTDNTSNPWWKLGNSPLCPLQKLERKSVMDLISGNSFDIQNTYNFRENAKTHHMISKTTMGFHGF